MTGLLMICFGVISIALTFISGTRLVIPLGSVIALVGFFYFALAYDRRAAEARFLRALLGFAYLTIGTLIAFTPDISPGMLNALMVSLFGSEGILELVSFFRMRDHPAPFWVLGEAVISLLFALILVRWPLGSAPTAAILFGVDQIVDGTARLKFSEAQRLLPRPA